MSKTNTNTYLIEEKHLTALEVFFKYLADHEDYWKAEEARELTNNALKEMWHYTEEAKAIFCGIKDSAENGQSGLNVSVVHKGLDGLSADVKKALLEDLGYSVQFDVSQENIGISYRVPMFVSW